MEMRALELNSEYYGVTRLQLMENAGSNVADIVRGRFNPPKKVAVFCGLGGNGGDGFVASRHLLAQGFEVEVVLAGKPSDISDTEARANWNALQPLRNYLNIHEIHDSSMITDLKADIVVDALLGIGLQALPRPPIRQLIRKINNMKAFCIAVDVPTGIDSDSGKVFEEAVKADVTVTFHKAKLGLAKSKLAGKVIVTNIGLPSHFERFAGPGDVHAIRKPRSPWARKGDFGRLLVIGGSETFSGAPALVAMAAYRAGVDLVYVAAPAETAHAISSMSPDLITVKLEGKHVNPRNISTLSPYLEKSTTVVIGPGLGLHRETKQFVREMIEQTKAKKVPMLLDADGLKAFAEFEFKVKAPLVLTPHSGEFKILTGQEPPQDIETRISTTKKTAAKMGAVILLKGHTDVISDGERVKLNFTGNPGMTVGGTGDVLSGVVAAFLSQGANPFEAAAAGAFINGAAGDFVESEKGYHMVATDLLEWIPKVIENPMAHLKVRKPDQEK
jgi:NAD(P)H-hydrate epimerase